MSESQALNPAALAFLGDAIYEQYVRERVIDRGIACPAKLHQAAIPYVCAMGQATALEGILPLLNPEERDLVRRVRNRKPYSRSRSADALTYKKATALEALVGSLYRDHRQARLAEVLAAAMAAVERKLTKEAEGGSLS